MELNKNQDNKPKTKQERKERKMKKILTVSLFAMMAVSAANAEIASTDYVTNRTGTVNFTSGSAAGVTNLTEAIMKVDAAISSASDSVTETLSNQIGELAGDVTAINNSDAMKSGITAAKVSTYDGYAATIAANTAAAGAAQGEVDALEGVVASNKTAAETALTQAKSELTEAIATAKSEAISGAAYNDTGVRGLIGDNAEAIEAIQNSEYATSGVTSAVVGQVTTNQNAIATINDSAVMNSGVDANVVAKANSAMQVENLKTLGTWTSEGCNAANATCSLVSKNGSIAWEKVSY